MAGNRVSDQPLRSANGGGLAGGDYRRCKQHVKGFCIWLNSFGGAHWQPRPFSIIMAVGYGSFLIGGISLKDTTPIYFHSATYAHEHGELDQYRASHKANIACKEAIEQAIADNYRDNRLGSACVQQVLQQFDYDRIFYVLANTVRQKDYDGRISRDNKTWAQTIPVCEDKDGFGYDRNVSFVVDRSHPGLMDLFLTQARDIAKEDFKMNQEFMSRKQVEFIRQTYPPNTRILLQHMDDPYAPVPTGTRGTVKYVDDIGQIGVAWDNGRSLSLIPGMDTYRKLTQQELTQEQGEKPSIHDSLGKHAGQQAAHSDKPKMKKEQTR